MRELHEAVHGIGASAVRCVRALSLFRPEDREQIEKAYQDRFNQDIKQGIAKLHSDNVIHALMQGLIISPNEHRVNRLQQLLLDAEPDQHGFFINLLRIDDQQRRELEERYQRSIGVGLTSVLSGNFSDSNWCRLLKHYVSAHASGVIDPVHGADQLKAAVGIGALDEEVFIRILTTISNENYREIVLQYQRKYFETIEEVIAREFAAGDRWPFLLIHYTKLDLKLAICFALSSSLQSLPQTATGLDVSYADLERAELSDDEINRVYAHIVDISVLFFHAFADSVVGAYARFGNPNLDWNRIQEDCPRDVLKQLWRVETV